MATFATSTDSERGASLTPGQIFEIARTREVKLSRMLMLFILTGLSFMLLPGTFLGVWNLLSISSRHASASISAPWIQAHGHAQIFGWIGSFILGIGFYSIPKLRRKGPFALWVAWSSWALWTAGVLLRWVANVYLFHWRILLPVSALMEFVAFVAFFRAVSGHKRSDAPPSVLNIINPGDQSTQGTAKGTFDAWVLVVIVATIGFLLTLAANLGESFYLALTGNSPAFPHSFDHRFLVLSTWGFLVPFVWGFSAKWMPVFLGLRATRQRMLLGLVALNSAGVIAALVGLSRISVLILLLTALLSPLSLRMFERPQHTPKTKGVHSSFPVFIRIAYLWLGVAAMLAVWAAWSNDAPGIWGASRHALTVGFIATMVFTVGQRILPAFSGMRLLFSPRLMFAGLSLLALGCALRVSMEVLAYQNYAQWAWTWLPVSAVTELIAVTLFAVNLLCTFVRAPVTSGTQPTQQRA